MKNKKTYVVKELLNDSKARATRMALVTHLAGIDAEKESYQVYIQTIAKQYDDLVEEVDELTAKLYDYVNDEQLMRHEIKR